MSGHRARVRTFEPAAAYLRNRASVREKGSAETHVNGVRVEFELHLGAHALEGREVRTVEGRARGRELHPVQTAFIAADGLECGFCTPGFVVEAVAFYEASRIRGRTDEPTREEVAAALAGHLCRGAAYPGTLEAVRRACSGEFDGGGEVHGPRVEAREKVTGAALYTVDIRFEGLLHGVMIRSTRAHARVSGIELGGVLVAPDVTAVRLLDPADPVARYVGQPLAAVAASSRGAAEEAAARVAVTYDPLPAVLDLDAALRGDVTAYEGTPRNPPNSSEGPIPPGRWNGNQRRARGRGMKAPGLHPALSA
ncbi:MAG: 2Fe-2S iron-sulfur cluster-binding protein [Gemmatimonadota bacterium]